MPPGQSMRCSSPTCTATTPKALPTSRSSVGTLLARAEARCRLQHRCGLAVRLHHELSEICGPYRRRLSSRAKSPNAVRGPERLPGGPAELVNLLTFEPKDEPQQVWSSGDVKVSAIRSTHVPGHASYRVDTPAGSVVIGGDAGNDKPAPPRPTSTSDQVEKLAQGVDIIVHSTMHPVMGPDKDSGMPPPIFYRQSSATDLGSMAQRAGAKYLVLTHLGPPVGASTGPLEDPGRTAHGGGLSKGGAGRWLYRQIIVGHGPRQRRGCQPNSTWGAQLVGRRAFAGMSAPCYPTGTRRHACSARFASRLDSGLRLRPARRGGARRRGRRRRLDPPRRDGRALRAEHHDRAGRGEGDPPA